MPEHEVFLLKGRFPCKNGTRGQGPDTMVKCELRAINESGHKLMEFLPDKQVIPTLDFTIATAGKQ